MPGGFRLRGRLRIVTDMAPFERPAPRPPGPLERDAEGLFVVVGLDVAEEVREALSLAGAEFVEGNPDDCGCGGPALALFRFGTSQVGGPDEAHLAAVVSNALDRRSTP